MQSEAVLFGMPSSVYVRAARLALEEKGVPYRIEPVNVFGKDGPPDAYLERHPFGRIPAFEHDGFRLYETSAITRYIDEAFPGPALQPSAPRDRARVNQILSIIDSYAYRTLVWDIYVERIAVPGQGGTSDETSISAALTRAKTCLGALEAIMADGSFLAGPALTLADLHAAPVFAYFMLTPEAEPLLAEHAGLRRWWTMMSGRSSMIETAPDK